ncbi:MAG: hypothetical protein IK095_05560 [Oscillospiraceae bacterium]|nr:hypothetical protein [Oscillospiraceae bacterium]
MRYTMKTRDNSLRCSISYDRKTWADSQVPTHYDDETIAYAACRYLRHASKARDRLVREAVRLGLNSGKKAKPYHHRVHTTATALALPGRDVWIHLRVCPGEIKICGVRILNWDEREPEPVTSRVRAWWARDHRAG